MDWPPGSHASTFGGNPVACRAALTTIDLLEREYMANADARGRQLREGLLELTDRHDCLANVRGLGLMTAVDVLKENGEPDSLGRDAVVQAAFKRGLLLLGCGESGIRFCPPLCVTAGQIETCLGELESVLTDRPSAVTV
jgi:4-aminobutyrate aminotransferase